MDRTTLGRKHPAARAGRADQGRSHAIRPPRQGASLDQNGREAPAGGTQARGTQAHGHDLRPASAPKRAAELRCIVASSRRQRRSRRRPGFRRTVRSGPMTRQTGIGEGLRRYHEFDLAKACVEIGADSTTIHDATSGIAMNVPIRTTHSTSQTPRFHQGSPHFFARSCSNLKDSQGGAHLCRCRSQCNMVEARQ